MHFSLRWLQFYRLPEGRAPLLTRIQWSAQAVGQNSVNKLEADDSTARSARYHERINRVNLGGSWTGGGASRDGECLNDICRRQAV